MADRIQQRRDTAARWAQYNPVLLEGEVGYVTDDPNQYKIGDGVHSWNDLPLRGYTGTIVQDTGSDENAVMSQKATTEKLNELERGGIYDVSAHNDGAVFESLSALLSSSNLSTLIPTSVHCGGMSIRFIQGSVPNYDNKYVQFRCMSDEFTTDVTKWQGVDAEPTAGSKNLVESEGSFRRDENTDIAIQLTLKEDDKNLAVGTIYEGNLISSSDSLYNATYIEVLPNRTYSIKHADDIRVRVTEYNGNKQYIRNTGSYQGINCVELSSTTKFIRISATYSDRGFNTGNPVTVSDYNSGDFAILIPCSEVDKLGRLNTIAYLSGGAAFEWTEGDTTTIKLNGNVIVKHLSGKNYTGTVSNLLNLASQATGFTVNTDTSSITFPDTGIMYFDMKARTFGFSDDNVVADDTNYIVLFAKHYTSIKYGLLLEYALNKNAIVNRDGLSLLDSKLGLYTEGTTVISTTSGADQKYYPISLKRGIYYIYNYGDAINSMYLCSSVASHLSHREITVGNVPSKSIVQINCNKDNIVCIDGFWPANTNFMLCPEENIHNIFNITKQKQALVFNGSDNTFIKQFFPVGKSNTYRIIPDRTSWPIATNTESYDVNIFSLTVNNVAVYTRTVQAGGSSFSALDSYIDVEIPDTTEIGVIGIGLRAASGEEVKFTVVNITEVVATTSPDVVRSTIFKTNPDEEFAPKVRTLKNQSPIGLDPTNVPLVLLWFSDLHADLSNLERINLWKTKYNSYINDILNTGDTINDNLANYDANMEAYFNNYNGANILLAIGNHDVTSPNSSYKAWDGTQSIKGMYDKYIGRLNANALGITQPANAAENGYCYYYKDYVGLGISTSGIRLIVIDSCITDADYQTTQVAWFIETLAAAKTLGYDVVVASHYMPGGCDEFDDARGFCYIEKQYRTLDYATVDSRFAAAIDDFITGGGKFVCWLCGHVHADHIGTVPSHSNQMVIAITAACSQLYGQSTIMPVRVKDSKAQDAFDHIEIDTYNKRVKLVRVGYNVDAMGRDVNMLAVDYQNRKVIV